MYILLIVLILIACVLLILAVLMQSPKSGMAANFGASNQVMGARQTSDFLEKATWTLAISILLLSLGTTMSMPKGKIAASKSGLEKAIERSVEGNRDFVIPNEFGTAPLKTEPTSTEAGPTATEGAGAVEGESTTDEVPQETN